MREGAAKRLAKPTWLILTSTACRKGLISWILKETGWSASSGVSGEGEEGQPSSESAPVLKLYTIIRGCFLQSVGSLQVRHLADRGGAVTAATNTRVKAASFDERCRFMALPFRDWATVMDGLFLDERKSPLKADK